MRIWVKIGGCVGMACTMEYAGSVEPDRRGVVEGKGVRHLVGPKAALFLLGTETDLQGRQACGPIRVQHPNQTLARGSRVGGADARGRKKLSVVDPNFIRELFAAFGPVRLRRMFFGIGIFADGMMFGYAVGGVIYLKTDDVIVADFAVEQSGPFLYPTKGGMRTLRSYWRLPERLYDDPEELALWARRSLEAARRAAARPRAAKPKRVKPPAARRAPGIPGRPRKMTRSRPLCLAA